VATLLVTLSVVTASVGAPKNNIFLKKKNSRIFGREGGGQNCHRRRCLTPEPELSPPLEEELDVELGPLAGWREK